MTAARGATRSHGRSPVRGDASAPPVPDDARGYRSVRGGVMSDVKIEHKQTLSRSEAATWLSLLSKALAADGQVELPFGPSEVKVHVPDQLRAEFEVEVEGDEVEIELEFTWSKARLQELTAAGRQPVSAPRARPGNGGRRSTRSARRLPRAGELSGSSPAAPGSQPSGRQGRGTGTTGPASRRRSVLSQPRWLSCACLRSGRTGSGTGRPGPGRRLPCRR